jgi:DNA helicase-2/ATP-dependent DNA helicase PcrA
MLRSTQETRKAAGALGTVLDCLADPTNVRKLARAYEAWRRKDREHSENKSRLDATKRALQRCTHVEEFLWPRPEAGLPDCLGLGDQETELTEHLLTFRGVARRWQAAVILPIDQLILTVAQDLFDRPAELALAHKLAVALRQASEAQTEWGLKEQVEELAVIARNERKFLGLADDDTGFDPEEHRGVVVVATAHKAKGLEWDRVYLTSVNSYDFPSALPGDTFISERWFIRDSLNLQEETLAQLKAAVSGDMDALYAAPGIASERARVEYAAERLRLLYVGITRAKRSLVITWNSGKRNDGSIREAVPLVALRTWWETGGTEEND